ncbi:MAG: ABC transporter substrate-binding protein [Clostridia bacterium]|nr:ABC transporter substrate-binding protein [Clostridia bacterium]
MKKVLAFVLLLALLMPACMCEAGSGIADGTYVPEEFVFSGGTGRVTITCPEVSVENGAATAKLVFSSRNYTSVRIDADSYEAEVSDEGAVFFVSVGLNRAFTVYATTVAMSVPHEIEYQMYIALGDVAPAGLRRTGSMFLRYARGFSVDYYEGGYAMISVEDGETYLVVPEGKETPEGLHPSVTVLKQPLDNIYLAATSAMSLFDAVGALDTIRLSGTQQDGWYVENAVKAMENGDIIFAGKYSTPDFELLIREHCRLAVESMMILHTPQVMELIRLLGIPVFIDRSSSEAHPLGRLEWIKLYGLLTGREAEAENVFEAQAAQVEAIDSKGGSGKTVAFFSVKPDGTVTVRGSEDYIARSIELAGGSYVFTSIEGQETNASVSVTMETFYMTAKDADYIIYNSAIEAPVSNVAELISVQPLLSDFRAVSTGNVFCTHPSLYQSTDKIGTFIDDLGKMLSGETEGMMFLNKLN